MLCLIAVVGFALVVRGRRGRRELALAATVVLLLAPATAKANVDEATDDAPGSLGALVFASASLDRGAFATRAAGRVRITDTLELGAAIEWNPWYSLETTDVVAGSLNLFATAVYRWATADGIALRSTVHVGTSVLLFELYGAERGSTGLFLGVSLLGVSIALEEHFALVVEPAEVMLPVPHLTGVPFYYRQYRFTLGLQWNP
jgi:hypothetical protein